MKPLTVALIALVFATIWLAVKLTPMSDDPEQLRVRVEEIKQCERKCLIDAQLVAIAIDWFLRGVSVGDAGRKEIQDLIPGRHQSWEKI